MLGNIFQIKKIKTKNMFTFLSITFFYFFESAQMSYFNILAPALLSSGTYNHAQIASISAAYYYGDVIGLLPVGFMLDRFPLRKTLLWAMSGSIIAAFLLFVSANIYLQWIARFFCGFFGGTFSFIGGIRILSSLFAKRFTFFIGLFLSAGMFGGLICQYPLLMMVNHFGISSAILSMAAFGLVVMAINFLFLHPLSSDYLQVSESIQVKKLFATLSCISKNIQNWMDCILVVLLDTPVSIIGTLWGVVILMSLYHFTDVQSTYIVMLLFLGLMIGLPLWGEIADRYDHPEWIVMLGAGMSFLTLLPQLLFHHFPFLIVGMLYFFLGFFSSCQTVCFTWLTKNMKPKWIGTNSAFNSMVFMSANGFFKQCAGCFLAMPSLLLNRESTINVLLFVFFLLVFAFILLLARKKMFKFVHSKNALKFLNGN
ncbi:MAG: hypothetical protein COY58_09065 [Gammaproteobacteria bacterium CG_4_10_14_0_8_um_filter_38_16]|nr:MAG: hypothetical protein COY58_09065 [Gammaproteobacteria bacterium CG_4_10_14_0_8_um_filter_38_16]PJA03391.1 MAG: hypothetical protein COX72_05500 [Gammaproteobacteria bacterium CG_4_10_14_0_2_um_filter_38_22]PJB11121.1 MAG: hypothetical protein CO120_01230 [Gammaproteobacteria bacterium CG_4_9_14_3_um_filter_38_9]